jgi:signal transduction histidine kinase
MILREASRRAVRLQTMVIPATRLAGLAVVVALMPLHNAAVLGTPEWSSVGAFALTASLYCLGSWLVLKAFFVRCRTVPLGDLFLIADIVLLLFAVQLSGGPKSWLFVLMAGRCVDQLTAGFRRTVWFNHLIVGSYAIYLLGASFYGSSLQHHDVSWSTYVAKLCLLYFFNWYSCLTARTVDSIRARARRAEIAKRSGAEIAGTVAHAIRTSTDGISVLAELLFQTPLNTRQRRYLRGLAEHSQDVLRKIPLLHSVVEVEAGAVKEAPFSPSALVEEVAALLRPLAESKGLDLRVEIGRETPLAVQGDAVKIRQVLVGLTHNSIRFTDVGSVELSCWRLWPGEVAFQVRDTGPGIPAHVCRSIATRFVRADGTLWQRCHGAQIGLSISKRLVEAMDGRLVLETEPGLGSSVRIELPMLGRSFFVTNAGAPPAEAEADRASRIRP